LTPDAELTLLSSVVKSVLLVFLSAIEYIANYPKGGRVMPKVTKKSVESPDEFGSMPLLSPSGQIDDLGPLAVDLIRKRLREGTASSQETTQILKLVASKEKERLEKELLEAQIELAKMKTQAISTADEIKEMYKNAMDAFSMYRGSDEYDGR
jgi:hypothetical protein